MDKPYVEGLSEGGPSHVTVTFTGQSGKAGGHEYTASGFWDGDQTWRVRFAPPVPGEWSYVSRSPDPGLNGKTGQFRCVPWTEEEKRANPTRRGLVRVCRTGARPGRYFEYADGTPMLWLGDTWWNWSKRGIPLVRFQKLADDRAEKGFNVGHLFFPGSGWKPESSLLDETFTQPDFTQIRHVEQMIRYANSKGITVWVNGWWAQPQMKDRIGEEDVRRWCRYMVHRLGAYNVVWVLAGEYNMWDYGGLGLDFWKALGRLIDEEDPYERIVGAHPTPPGWKGGEDAPQWSTAEVLHDEPWLDYPGARSLGFMAGFLRGIEWWRLEPHPELVSENPSPFCGAVPGREYVVYLRWGGVVKVDLRPSTEEDQFEYRWIDLVEEKTRRSGIVGGGDVRTFRPPEDYPGVEQFKDWVLHVVRR